MGKWHQFTADKCFSDKVSRETSGVDIQPERNEYAFFYSKDFETIMTKKKKDVTPGQLDGYIKIRRGRRKVYLRYYQYCKVKRGNVMLTYTNLCRLGIVDEIPCKVEVSKASWFGYNFNNPDRTTRLNFRIALAGFLVLLLVDLPEFVNNICNWFLF